MSKLKTLLMIVLAVATMTAAVYANMLFKMSTLAARKAGIESAIGYPAGVEQIKHDGVYYLSTSVVDIWPDRTNITAILQEIMIVDLFDYRHNPTNRLFTLPWDLERGYYRFFRGGTNLSFMEIPPPIQKP